jgi:putrescine aminotransferase
MTERIDLNELLEKDAMYVAQINVGNKRPLVMEEGHGMYVKDISGREYMDCTAGISVNNLGHGHPKIIEAIRKQSERILHTYPFGNFISRPQVELAELLAKLAPGRLSRSFFCNSGTEATEGALKLARKCTMKKWLISCEKAFHGRTLGSTSVTWKEVYRKPFEPLLPACQFVPYGDADALERAITDDTAAFIVEPVQGEAGFIVPPPDYLPRVREICTKHSLLMIVDEVQTAFGRTGKMFACEHWNVTPDVMTLGKAITCGGVPMGAFISTPEIMDSFRWPPLSHCTTYGGHALACAVAVAAIRTTIDEKLPEKAAERGAYFKKRLEELKAEFPHLISEVRGLGLMLGVALRDTGVADAFVNGCFDKGVIVIWTINSANAVRISPPLIITKEEIDEVISRFTQVLKGIR